MKKQLAFRLIAIGLGVAVPLLFLEVILRILPVYSGFKFAALNDSAPIPHFTPNQNVTWSKGWNFQLRNKLRVNNYGFVNDQDYDPSAAGPLLAVVGDSYIEAAMVPYARTLQGRLAREVAGQGRVYSFGKSGAPLSMYLVWAQFAREEFNAAGVVIPVIGNDFDESLNQYKTMRAGYYYIQAPDGELVLERFDYEPTGWRVWGRKSALVRYLTWHLEMERTVLNLFGRREEYVGNVQARKSDVAVAESKRAVDAFLRDLLTMTGLPPDRILFIVDGMRPHLYEPAELEKARGSFVDQMRDYFMQQAAAGGFEVLDLQPVFIEEFQRAGRRFEYPADAHWNDAGHAVAADAIKGSRLFESIFRPDPQF
jgi:hypothetical protein